MGLLKKGIFKKEFLKFLAISLPLCRECKLWESITNTGCEMSPVSQKTVTMFAGVAISHTPHNGVPQLPQT